MIIVERNIVFSGEELTLNSQRALFWKRQNMLILADLHLGKAAHFRKNGIALPIQTSLQDLQQLQGLINRYNPRQVVVVGDLLHAGANKEVALFKDFTAKFPDTRFILIKGNHDRFSKRQLNDIGIYEIHTALQIESIMLSHQPISEHPGNTIVGHIHPGINIKTLNKSKMRFPCFVIAETQITLPAFSRFTGLNTNHHPENATFFAIYDDGIFEISE